MLQLSKLKAGDTIGLITPAAAVSADQVDPGLNVLRQRGFNLRYGTYVYANHGITAAPAMDRLEDINYFLDDDNVKAIWALRGGYGTIQLLDKLDYSRFQKNPKWLVGFSDVTALQWALYQKIQLPTLSGLTITTQVSEENPYLEMGLEILAGTRHGFTDDDIPEEELQVRRDGSAGGVLIGGNLAMICSLAGTGYFNNSPGMIVFIEDIGEPLYRLDRLLQQLALMGFWQNVNGVILGKFIYEQQEFDVFPLLSRLLPKNIPVISNFPHGHMPASCPLPIGVEARLSTGNFELSWTPVIA